MDAYTSRTTKPIFYATQMVWYILGILETLLVFRFVLKMIAANPDAGFTSFIYNVTQPLVQPFISVFRVTLVEGSVFEWTTILAMAVYWLIGEGINRLFVMNRSISTPEAAARLEERARM